MGALLLLSFPQRRPGCIHAVGSLYPRTLLSICVRVAVRRYGRAGTGFLLIASFNYPMKGQRRRQLIKPIHQLY